MLLRSNAAPGMRRLENVNMNCINLPEATAAVFASCARPGQAEQGRAGTAQASPGFTAFRLRTAERESTKKERRHGAAAGGGNNIRWPVGAGASHS